MGDVRDLDRISLKAELGHLEHQASILRQFLEHPKMLDDLADVAASLLDPPPPEPSIDELEARRREAEARVARLKDEVRQLRAERAKR
jgi:hypothetical protein